MSEIISMAEIKRRERNRRRRDEYKLNRLVLESIADMAEIRLEEESRWLDHLLSLPEKFE